MSVVRIGVAVPDLADFVALEPAYGVGDQREQVETALDVLRRAGSLGDLDLEPVYGRFSVVDTEQKRQVADDFAAAGVLAVIGARDFTYGAVRLAERHQIPVLDVNAVPRSLLMRTDPWLFVLRSAQDVLYRAFVRWAHREGHLDGATIGVYADRFTRESTAHAVLELRQLGHEVAVRLSSDGAGIASETDLVAAERFRDAGVDVVLPFVSGSSLVGLLRELETIGAGPRIVDLETGEHTTDVTAHMTPSGLYDGTIALTMNRVGEAGTASGLVPRAAELLDALERRTGRRLEASGWRHSGEVSNLLIVHDLILLLILGLGSARRPVDGATLVTSLQSIEPATLAGGGLAYFRPGENWAMRQGRAVRWSAADDRWFVVGEYEDLAAI